MTNPEVIGAILPRLENGRRGDPHPDEVEEVRRLSIAANHAREDFIRASHTFCDLTQQIAKLQEDLMQAAIDMHDAKYRSDKIVATVKNLAGVL